MLACARSSCDRVAVEPRAASCARLEVVDYLPQARMLPLLRYELCKQESLVLRRSNAVDIVVAGHAQRQDSCATMSGLLATLPSRKDTRASTIDCTSLLRSAGPASTEAGGTGALVWTCERIAWLISATASVDEAAAARERTRGCSERSAAEVREGVGILSVARPRLRWIRFQQVESLP